MKRIYLVLTAFMLALPLAVLGQTPQEQADKEEKAELSQILASHYGMNREQIAKYMVLDERRSAQREAVKDQVLTYDQRREKNERINASLLASAKTFVTPAQYAKLEKNLPGDLTKNGQCNKLFNKGWKQTKEQMKANTSDVTNDVLKFDFLDRYEKQITPLVGATVAANKKKYFYKREILKASYLEGLGMNFNQMMDVAEIVYNTDRAIVNIRRQGLPDKERIVRIKELRKQQDTNVKNLLGGEKYAQYVRGKSMAFDKKYKKRYGFTPQQLAQYKEIKNDCAVKRYQVAKNKSISPVDKTVRADAIWVETEAKLKAIMSADQYTKWLKEDRNAECRQNKL